jgi:CO dehydrogenase maturation factor
MILGFFGKGGSGKTTTSFRCAESLKSCSTHVLAVDADHNMDLAYNFGLTDSVACLGADATIGLVKLQDKTYTLSSLDEIDSRYLHRVSDGLSLLLAGPHTDPIFKGDLCSHGLLKPIIHYLARLHLKEGENVVVDATAGMDSIGAGLPSCLDAGVVCVEPTVHSIKVAHQLLEGLSRLNVPTVVVANKLQTEQQANDTLASFPGKQIISIPFSPSLLDPRSRLSETDRVLYRSVFDAAVKEQEKMSAH